MLSPFDDLLLALESWAATLGILGLAVVFALVTRWLIVGRLLRLAEKTSTRLDNLAYESLASVWIQAIVLAAIVPAVRLAPLAVEPRVLIERFAVAAVLLTLTWALSTFLGRWLDGAGGDASGAVAQPSLVRKLARGAVLIAGALLVLDNLGIEISALLTALGLGSLAIALGLQPTLANLFAGIHLSMAKPIRVGDFIQLEDGSQGHVADISWRATRIRQLANNDVIVPNSKLAEMRIVNYSQPELEQAVVVPVGVGYGADLEQVERVVLEEARRVEREVPGGVATFEPVVRFTGFGDSAVNFNVILRAAAFTDRVALTSELYKRLKRRFDAEGIEIPFPQRVVHFPAGAATPPAAES